MAIFNPHTEMKTYAFIVTVLLLLSCDNPEQKMTVIQDSTAVVPNYTIQQSDTSNVIIVKSTEELTLTIPAGMKPGTMFIIIVEQ
jgi:hypothetical protein